MNIHIILLIISLMLTIISSWNLSIFIRLKNASDKYTSDDDVFYNSCHISKNYITVSYKFSILILIISILLMIFSSITIYKY